MKGKTGMLFTFMAALVIFDRRPDSPGGKDVLLYLLV